MHLRAFYRAAAVLPLAGIALAAAARATLEAPLEGAGAGGRVEWLYPTSLTRGLAAYALLAGWLWVEIGRRPLDRLRPLIWRAPVVYVVLNAGVLGAFALAHGHARELLSAHGAVVALRAAIHLAVGYAYLGLTEIALGRLSVGLAAEREEPAG